MVANTRTTPHRDPRRRHPARRRRGGSSIPVAGFTSAPPTRTGTARFSQPVSPQNAAPTANKLLPPTSEMCPLEPVLGLFVRTAAHAVPVCSGAAGFGFGAAPATPAVVRAAADARAAIRLRIVSPLICRPGRRLPPLLRGGYSEHKLRGDRQADPDHEPAERARPGPPPNRHRERLGLGTSDARPHPRDAERSSAQYLSPNSTPAVPHVRECRRRQRELGQRRRPLVDEPLQPAARRPLEPVRVGGMKASPLRRLWSVPNR
jgi:hypothetical protein